MNELIFIQDTLFSVSNIINGGPVLGVDFTEGVKPENPEKNPQRTGQSDYDNSIHMSPKFESRHRAVPKWSPIQLMPRPTGLNLKLRGERQRANYICHLCLHRNCCRTGQK